MGCGNIAWWRAMTDDLDTLVDRHGTIEHFLVQQDFVLLQPQRVGIAEYSIPGASWKSKRSGAAGYADIVSFVSSEIWEIKPRSGGDKPAVDKAKHYVTQAQAKCGPKWHLGDSYSTSGGDGVVFHHKGGGNTAELMAKQGQKGAVLYYWKINGECVDVLDPVYRMAIYKIVMDTYFSSPVPQRLPGAQPRPNDVPPGKWKPPILRPDSVPAVLRVRQFLTAMVQAVQKVYPRILDGSAVAVALDLEIYNSIVGGSVVQRQVGMMQVPMDPTVTLYRQTVLALTVVGGSAPLVVGLGFGGGWVLGEVIAIGTTAIAATLRLVAGAATVTETAVTGGALLRTLTAALNASPIARLAVPAGASTVVFIIPSAASANPRTPDSVRVSIPLVKWLPPSDAQRARTGDSIQDGGKEFKVVALMGTDPD
jgi:hypothetical protein